MSKALLSPTQRPCLERIFNHLAYALCEWDHATAPKDALRALHDAVMCATL